MAPIVGPCGAWRAPQKNSPRALGAGDVVLQWAAVLGLVGSVVAAFYYLRLIKSMWFDAPAGSVDAPRASDPRER